MGTSSVASTTSLTTSIATVSLQVAHVAVGCNSLRPSSATEDEFNAHKDEVVLILVGAC